MKKAIAGAVFVIALLIVVTVVLPARFAGATQQRSAQSHHPSSAWLKEHPRGRPAAGSVSSSVSSGVSSSGSWPAAYSCGQPAGSRIINVTEKIVNDIDSGLAGYWAYDTIVRQIQVWNVGPDQYCASVTYQPDQFAAVAGQISPGTSGILTGEEFGNFNGSYNTYLFTAQLNVVDPFNWPTSGVVNGGATINYACNAIIGPSSCSGYIDWATKYFTNINGGAGFSLNQWGWTYIGTESDGTSTGIWVNAYNGTHGDILDTDEAHSH